MEGRKDGRREGLNDKRKDLFVCLGMNWFFQLLNRFRGLT